jgi:lipoate-protein ligase A
MDGTLHLLRLENYPILQQLQLEEALLRADTRNWCIINRGSPAAVVMGISGKKEELINSERYGADPIPLIRRFSGGGTVVVDENTIFVSFILNHIDATGASCPKSILDWTVGLYESFLNEFDFRLQENDYALGSRKFGGNAQYLCKDRWLHHTTLLWDYHPGRMDYLLLPKKRPAYRKERSHGDFLCTLKEVVAEKQQVETKLLAELALRLKLKEVSLQETLPILELSHRKATVVLE